MVLSVIETKNHMDSYVASYQAKYDAALADYRAKVAIREQTDPHDRAAILAAREAEAVAEKAMNEKLSDLENARKYAEREIAKAEKAEAQAEKAAERQAAVEEGRTLTSKVVSGATKAVGVGALAVGGAAVAAGAVALKAGKWTKDKLVDTPRLAMQNTASAISMTFAKYILGYKGMDLPKDPTRKNWDPSVKRAKQSGHCHSDPECQPSFF